MVGWISPNFLFFSHNFFVLYDRDKSFHEKKIISVVKKKIQNFFFPAAPRDHQGGTEGVKFKQKCYFLNIYAWKTVQIIPIYTIEIVSSEWALSGILPIFFKKSVFLYVLTVRKDPKIDKK